MRTLLAEYGKTILTAMCVAICIIIVLNILPLIGFMEINALKGAIGLM